ncbi:hypothetical protein MUG94_14615 [Arthrobacter gengyunqii]|uniref:Uncharacterized protein n=1 Tax=Arthrobacter gengyunqii TaxID=2886940 RepID=A0A9X1S6H6_9MICC|nr:hypothetical protein [Arthrobacter gengyunqii]MCC3268349.1 hypothetical protein [Arthrobacter gengyunqii]UOY95747.1 hypothetical protein MUG94_14615 [Arthrobacter gengyunqii]
METSDRATKHWFDDLVVELRLQDVPGDAIGDAVASAREFLADSGGTPIEVFGSARAYAESLDLPRNPASLSGMAALLVPTCLGLLGFFAVAAAVSSTDAAVDVTLPGLLLILTGLALAACAPWLLGFFIRGPVWRPAAGLMVVFTLQVLMAVLAKDTVLFTLPAVPTALIGGLVLLSTSLWGQFRKGAAPDPLVDPMAGPPSSSFGITLLEVLANWMLFLAAAAMAAWFLLRT